MNNSFVVPYNAYLLDRFDCHINVEVCSTVSAVKYLYKYITKGHDRALVQVENEADQNQAIDEVQRFLDSRYIGPVEAAWRIFEFSLCGQMHSVERLPVHLPGQQMVVFDEDAPERGLERAARTKLTAFFELCCQDENARQYLYHEIPEHYTWKKETKRWQPRQNHTKKIARMYMVNPAEGERFYLRLLLCHVRGPRSFEDLRTFEGQVHATFHEAAVARGLCLTDHVWDSCMEEAAASASAKQLRDLFIMLLVHCQVISVIELFNTHLPSMRDDYTHQGMTEEEAFHHVAQYIDDKLRTFNKSWYQFGLPPFVPVRPNAIVDDAPDLAIANDAPAFDIDALNEQQREVFEAVRDYVEDGLGSNLFFVDGPGGTGKTFLYNTMINYYKSQGKKVLVVASSGIAACLLPDGCTAHSTFGIPIQLNADSISTIDVASARGRAIAEADIIFWDEAVMMHRHGYETTDRLLKDLMQNDLLFGGKAIIFGGDFRQVLPVVINGNRAQIVRATMSRSQFW